MNSRSVKSKGKRLEKLIVKTILETFSELDADDVKSTVGQESGADIKFSKKARTLLPIKIEAKNRETLTEIYKYYDQCCSHKEAGEPVVVLKKNFRDPLVFMNFSYFLNLLKRKE